MKKTGLKTIERVVLFAFFVFLAGLFFIFDIGQYLTLDYIKTSQIEYRAFYEDNTAWVIASYMAIYIAVAALSLPGAAALTIAGGALLGFVVGTVAISFASTIGATLACAASRFVFRDWVQMRFGDKLDTINQGVRNEGKFYLFTLRLIPIFPFFMINLLMGLTSMRLSSFYWVSQLGMLAGTMVYVNAGRELGQLDSLSGIFSPGLIISFALLGLFPITIKKLIRLYRKKHGLQSQPNGGKNG
jgi:uncharacterized membrane protein YdjX (TVP38/TMEM64 family)